MFALPKLGEGLCSGNYEINWSRCADLPAPMYGASAAVDGQKIYVAAGCAPDINTYQQIFCYNITSDKWSRLPAPGHTLAILCIVDGKLNAFGGHDEVNKMATNKVSTLTSGTNKWIGYFPNMLNVRSKPGVVVYLEHIIVAGGARDRTNFNDDIEILNWQQPPLQWLRVEISLPVPMWAISLTVSSDKLFIVGYNQIKGRSTSVYQLPVKSLVEQPLYANELRSDDTWIKLCSAPYHDTALVPSSDPPVIVGGNSRGLPTSDISVYSPSGNCWRNCTSLSSSRANVAVETISDDTFIVIGGNTRGPTIEAAMGSTMTLVEIGQLRRLKKHATLPRTKVETNNYVLR